MKRSVKLFFKLDDVERKTLFDTFDVVSKAFNDHVDWAFKRGTYSKAKAHKELYRTLREKHVTLPSALLQSTRDTALEAVKALKFKHRPTKKPMSSMRYDVRTLSLRGQTMTLSTVDKRIKVRLTFSRYHTDAIEGMRRLGGSTVGYDRDRKRFFVVLTYESANREARREGETIGIDRGLKNLVTTSLGEFLGNEINGQRRKHTHLRKMLSAKGTRSAKRLLKRRSGKEMRFNRDVNHKITKQLANDATVRCYVIEDLKGISKKRRGKMLNRWLHSWPFFQFETFLGYKCAANGIDVKKVSAQFTSQGCSSCNHREKANRVGHQFKCTRCGHREHADVNAAKNIRDRHLTSLLTATQGESQPPARMGAEASRPRYQPRAGVG